MTVEIASVKLSELARPINGCAEMKQVDPMELFESLRARTDKAVQELKLNGIEIERRTR